MHGWCCRSKRRSNFILQLSEMAQDSEEGAKGAKPKRKSLKEAFSTASSAMTASAYIQVGEGWRGGGGAQGCRQRAGPRAHMHAGTYAAALAGGQGLHLI